MTRKTVSVKPLNTQFGESLHNVRFALLGAYGMARKEATKLSQALIAEGKRRETRTIEVAEQHIDEVRQEAKGLVKRVEHLLEERVERSLKTLGVATRDDVQALSSQVDRLTRQVNKLHKSEDTRHKSAA